MKLDLIQILSLAFLLGAGPLFAADESNAPTRLDSSSFEIISRRNIFDPNRRGDRIITNRPPPARVDSFTLVGTMSSEKGRYAFFDSSSSLYRKTLKPSDTIAGYTIVDVLPDGIKLAASSNQVITVAVGNQMRRREGGPWSLRSRAESGEEETVTVPGATPDLSAKAATLNGAESDALKRLMMKRLQEK